MITQQETTSTCSTESGKTLFVTSMCNRLFEMKLRLAGFAVNLTFVYTFLESLQAMLKDKEERIHKLMEELRVSKALYMKEIETLTTR